MLSPKMSDPPSQAEADRVAAETDRDAAVGQAREEAARRIVAAEADREAAIEQARAEASQQACAAEADRDLPSHTPRAYDGPGSFSCRAHSAPSRSRVWTMAWIQTLPLSIPARASSGAREQS